MQNTVFDPDISYFYQGEQGCVLSGLLAAVPPTQYI